MPNRFPYVGTAALAASTPQQPYNFGTGTHTFTVPKSGYWKFVVWGEGGGAAGADTKGAASGAYAEKTKRLSAGQTVTVAVLTNVGTSGYNGATTTVTFPDTTTVTCTGGTHGSSPTGGTATGGDVNISGSANATAGGGTNGGSAGGTSDRGGGAPANTPYRGGDGGTGNPTCGGAPGGGGDAAGGATTGGGGMVLAVFIHD